MPDSDNLQAMESRREEVQRAIGLIGDFRQGSLTQMYRRCGKPQVHSKVLFPFRHSSCFLFVIPAKAGIQGRGGAKRAFPRLTPPGFPLSRE